MTIHGLKVALIEDIMDFTEEKGIEVSDDLSKGLEKLNAKQLRELQEIIYKLIKG